VVNYVYNMNTKAIFKFSCSKQAKIVAVIFACVFVYSFNPIVLNAQTTNAYPKALFYVTNASKSIVSLRAHAGAGDIISPQTYVSTPKGKLLGKPKQEVLDIAQSIGADVMPLVSNQNFSQTGIDSFLKNTDAQDALIVSLIREARDKKYIGYQYDFEHIPSYDRDLYSKFVERSVPIFHNSNLKISIAIAPIHSENPHDFGPGSWQNWTGAFDYTALGKAADFVSVMAYDDSLSVGPTASLPWVTQVAEYTLSHIPANKVSFGVPFYAWIRNSNTGKRVAISGYPVLGKILENRTYIDRGFSDELGVPWVKYKNNKGKILTAWYEDSQSFQQKISLIKSKNMFGYSAWALGLEDPKVWDVVMAMKEGNTQVAAR
jgi:spore germination protein YaaH